MKRKIGICLGDVTGIGPEVTLKALAAEAQSGEVAYVLYGDAGHILKTNERLGLGLKFSKSAPGDQNSGLTICEPLASLPAELAPGASAAAHSAPGRAVAAPRSPLAGTGPA